MKGLRVLVRTQATRIDELSFNELRKAASNAGVPENSLVSMVELEQNIQHLGLWTYKPWIHHICKTDPEAKWLLFIEPTSTVDFEKLSRALGVLDSEDEIFLGKPLSDAQPSILHHYDNEGTYPQVLAGFVLSGALARGLGEALKKNPLINNQQIEPVWELSKWIRQERGVALTDRSDLFCTEEKETCVTHFQPASVAGATGEGSLFPADVVIAVKTVSHFHSSRISLVRDFWAKTSPVEVIILSNAPYEGNLEGDHLMFRDLSPEFGDWVDPAKESTKQGSGHCSKMMAILQYLSRHVPSRKWYVVVDDDTLLNVPALLKTLEKHSPSKALYLGERYGWGHRETISGNNYITTGGGMAMTQPALEKVLSCNGCRCRAPDVPDDMSLGSWFTSLGVPILNEPGFHQSEPDNYHPEVVRLTGPVVSFHRFGTRLPASASEKEKKKAQRKNWRDWVNRYFSSSSSSSSSSSMSSDAATSSPEGKSSEL